MTNARKIIIGGSALGLSQIVGQLCSLGRNAIIARMVSPADFGVAAIFLMMVSFLDMISNLSLDRLLVQSKDGNDQRLQDVAHFLQVLRGVINCCLLLLLAHPLSVLFNISEARGSFYTLAILPLVSGFMHLDTKRMERDMRFLPGAWVEVVSQLMMLILAFPASKFFGDYRAMLSLLLLKSLIMLVGTHYTAERSYKWSSDRHLTKRFLSFGWPLLVNGVLMFAIYQGDRFIIGSANKLFGSELSMTDVGLYSAGFILAMMPAMLIVRFASQVFLPLLSKEIRRDEFGDCKMVSLEQYLIVAALLYTIVMVSIGDRVMPIIYGHQYISEDWLVAYLSVMWSIRIMRVMPVTVSMAKGNTVNIMYSNCVRVLALCGVVMVIIGEMSLVWVAIIGIFGEMLAYVTSLFLNKLSFGVAASLSGRCAVLYFVSLCILYYINTLVFVNSSNGVLMVGVCGLSMGFVIVSVFVLPVVKNHVIHYGRRVYLRMI